MNQLQIILIKDKKKITITNQVANKLIKLAEKQNKTIQEIFPDYKVIIT